MKREIKFRAWYIDEKKLCYGVGEDSEFDFQYWDGVEVSKIEMINMTCESRNISLMQYTGLKDINGKEIYEGDIVRVIFEDTFGEIEKIGVAEWSNIGLQYIVFFGGDGVGLSLDRFEDIEIIGNIYENPELSNK